MPASPLAVISAPARKPGGKPPMLGPGMRRYLLSEIIAHTAAVFEVPVETILGHCRNRPFVRPRQCIALIAKVLCPHLSYPQMGTVLHRDHSTVIHSAEMGEYLFERDADFNSKVMAVVAAMEPVSSVTWLKPKPQPEAVQPEPEPEPEGEWDEVEALSRAVQQHFAQRERAA